MHSASSPFVLHALPISSSLTWWFQLYLVKGTSYDALHCAGFSNLLTLPVSITTLKFYLVSKYNWSYH
jgi:hypothetical protein